jgi:hypothetical protein
VVWYCISEPDCYELSNINCLLPIKHSFVPRWLLESYCVLGECCLLEKVIHSDSRVTFSTCLLFHHSNFPFRVNILYYCLPKQSHSYEITLLATFEPCLLTSRPILPRKPWTCIHCSPPQSTVGRGLQRRFHWRQTPKSPFALVQSYNV